MMSGIVYGLCLAAFVALVRGWDTFAATCMLGAAVLSYLQLRRI